MSGAQAESGSKMECSKDQGRNLVVCIDGTNNQFGDKNTNVIELYDMLIKDTVGSQEQLTWYNSGIGTYAKPSWFSYESMKQWIDSSVDLMVAWNFEAIILDAYRWLSDVYQPGDRIFVFGFSRGAYQARALAAMIDKVGLIYRGNEGQIPFAFELFANPASGSALTQPTGDLVDPISMAQHFRNTFSRKVTRDGKLQSVRVHFVGVWDTVSSVGLARDKTLPGTTDGMRHMCYFRHALALDERRVKFQPEFAYGGMSEKPAEKPKVEESGFLAALKRLFKGWFGPKEAAQKTLAASESTEALLGEQREEPNPPVDTKTAPVDTKTTLSKDSTQDKTQPKKLLEQTKEVWFAGTHSDVGGGNKVNLNLKSARPPLRWMCFEAAIAGLHVQPFSSNFEPEAEIEVYNSMTWKWRLFELYPFRQLTYKEDTETARRWHLAAGRKICQNQKIHSSVFSSKSFKDGTYVPAAELNSGSWDDLRKSGASPSLVENDLYDGLPDLLHEYALDTTSPERKGVIATMLVSAGGQWGLSQRLKNKKVADKKPQASQELRIILDVYGKQRPTELLSRTDVDELLSGRLELSNDKQKSAKRLFLGQFTAPLTAHPLTLNCTEPAHVRSAVYSPDGTRFAISHYQLICVRYAATGEWIGSAEVPEYAYDLAFSHDGRHLAAVSSRIGNCICSVYDVDAGMTETELKLEESPYSCALASGARGDILAVCGGEDGCVFAYSVSSGDLVWTSGDNKHARPVVCLAVSQDGKQIASGSRDSTIFVWDVATGDCLAGPFTLIVDTHEWVTSLVFSADGMQLAVGSDEGRVRLLNAQSGHPVVNATQVNGYIQQVAIRAASDGQNHVVFATKNGRVFFWDASNAQSANIYDGDDHHVAVLSPDCKTVLTGYRKLLDVTPDIGYWSGDLMRQINTA